MEKYFENNTWGYDILYDWYVNGVDETKEPKWTPEHIGELTNDFYVIPKQIEFSKNFCDKKHKCDNEEILLKMTDGGMVGYEDDNEYHSGCETCDYGSQYITEIRIELTKFNVYVRTNQMYQYAISQGDMMRLFLRNSSEINEMTELEFCDWFRKWIENNAFDKYSHGYLENFDVEKRCK